MVGSSLRSASAVASESVDTKARKWVALEPQTVACFVKSLAPLEPIQAVIFPIPHLFYLHASGSDVQIFLLDIDQRFVVPLCYLCI